MKIFKSVSISFSGMFLSDLFHIEEETLAEYKKRVASTGGNARKAQNPDYSKMGKKGMKSRYKKKGKIKKLFFD